jgi:glyoxylase-like metal-dependent hydrolase (beta-lactamase superfamily II)
MELKAKPMGSYQTNCYIVTIDGKDIIIDPGMGATSWVLENTTNPIAILNTHGHFDHIWSNHELKEKLKIPIYVPKDDAFMLKNDPFGHGTPPSEPDFEIDRDVEFELDGIKVKYIHMPGHTPGNSIIIIEDCCFSGDFIFENSIGRVDFPYSNPEDMKKSIKKFLKLDFDKKVYTGHGNPTTIKIEQARVGNWLNYI